MPFTNICFNFNYKRLLQAREQFTDVPVQVHEY